MVVDSVSGNVICVVCLQAASQYAEEAPMGSITCPVCRKYDGFRLQYTNGATARWLFAGMDQHKNVIYTVVSTKGNWSTLMYPERMYCVRCDSKVPLDLLVLNPYIYKRRK